MPVGEQGAYVTISMFITPSLLEFYNVTGTFNDIPKFVRTRLPIRRDDFPVND